MDAQGRNRLALGKEFLNLGRVLGLSSAGCALFFLVRLAITGKFHYAFLLWNLFLAWVPFLIAAFLFLATRADRAAGPPAPGTGPGGAAAGWKALGRRGKAILVGCGLLWLLFYPNAPYIFTDIIHLTWGGLSQIRNAALGLDNFLWYDLIMTATFAFTGHFIGLVSMFLVNEALGRRIGRAKSNLVLSLAALFAGIGVYLGRFVRLNSWDLIIRPGEALAEIREYLLTPKGLLFSLAFGFFILVSYHAFRSFKKLGV